MEDGEIADGSPIEYTYSHKQYPERCHTEHHTVLANGRRDRTAKGRLHSERHDRHSRERERDSKRRRQHESSHRESSSYSRKRHDSSRYTDHDNHGKRRDSTTSSTRHTRDTLLLATNTTTTNTSAKPKDGNDSTTTTTVPSSLLQVVSKSPLVLTKPRDSSSSCASVEKQEETCVVSLENEDKAESEADEEDFLMESPAEREERLIQEARQRRLAILAKHNNTNQQSRPDTPMMSKEDSVDPSVAIITDSPIPFFDLSKDMSSTTVTTVTGGQEITMNAAEYDPEMDAKREWAQRQEKKGLDVHQVHHQQAVPVVESAPTKEDVQKQEQQLENKVTEEDMFAPEDDMFAPTFDATLLKQSDKAIATAHVRCILHFIAHV